MVPGKKRLNELEWLFDSVWAMFKAQHPTGEVPDEELETNLRRTLFALTCSGNLHDEDELRAHLLASVRLVRARHGGVQDQPNT